MPTGTVKTESEIENQIDNTIKGNLVDTNKVSSPTHRTLWRDVKRTLFYWIQELQTLIGNKANLSHTHNASDIDSGTFNVNRIPNLDASKITSGVFDIARIPAGAKETVYNYTGTQTLPHNFGLTINDVQNGDTVRINNPSNPNHLRMWIVVNDASLNQASSFVEYSAANALTLGGFSLAQVLDRTNHTGTQAQSTINGLTTDLANKADISLLNEIIENGTSYPNATALQAVRNSIVFIGTNYPTQKRVSDLWLKRVASPVFQSITGLTSSAFTYNYLAGTFTNQDGNPETQLANRYRVQISTSPTMSGAQEYTTTALFYAFTGLTQPTYYVRVRAEVFIDGGYEFSDWSNVEQVNVVSDPYLALNPVMYLDGTSLNDLGSYGGTWIEVGGTVDFVGGRINLDAGEYLRRTFTPGIQLNNTSTDNYFIVLKLRMDTTSASNIAFLQLADVVFTSGNFFGVATLNTADIRLERSGANGGTLTNIRTGNEIKVVVRSLGSNTFECWVNPTVGGETTDTKIGIGRPSASTIVENISIGGRLSGTQAKANGIPYINKFALYRGTLPTYDQIAALP